MATCAAYAPVMEPKAVNSSMSGTAMPSGGMSSSNPAMPSQSVEVSTGDASSLKIVSGLLAAAFGVVAMVL